MGTEVDSMQHVLAEVEKIKTFVTEKVEEGVKPTRDEVARIAKSFSSVQDELREVKIDKALRVGQEGPAKVRSGRLSGFRLMELSFAEKLLRLSMKAQGLDDRAWPETRLGKEIASGRKQIRETLSLETVAEWGENSLKACRTVLPSSTGYHALARFRGNMDAWGHDMRGQIIKAMDSTTAAAGDELVPTFESAELWRDVNLITAVLPLFEQVPMPTSPYDLPRDFGDTNWYPGTENVAVTTTDLSTGKDTITAYTLRTGVPFSDELSEDSIVQFAPNLRVSLLRNAAEVIEDVLINGDTTTSNGINSDGAVISTTSAGKAHWLLGFDGLRHQPLVDNTGARADVNAAMTAANTFNRVLRLMRVNAAPQTRGDVAFVAGVNGWITALTLDEVETIEKYGIRATISSGELASIYGTPIIVSEWMRLADTDGLVTDSGNATDTSSILGVNATQWKVGLKRGVTVEPDREAAKGQSVLYVSLRIGFVAKGARSSARHTAIAYDITGTT